MQLKTLEIASTWIFVKIFHAKSLRVSLHYQFFEFNNVLQIIIHVFVTKWSHDVFFSYANNTEKNCIVFTKDILKN